MNTKSKTLSPEKVFDTLLALSDLGARLAKQGNQNGENFIHLSREVEALKREVAALKTRSS